jgi:NADH-quinone oxidoreductase subunit J
MNWELLIFVIFAVTAVAGAFVLIGARNPVYSAMGLLTTMFSIAVFYILLDAQFIAAVQVIIYAGAVMTLFLFVIMLIGVDRSDRHEEVIPFQRALTAIFAVAVLALFAVAGRQAWVTGSSAFGDADLIGTVENVADELFGIWTIAFLTTVFLLTIAAVGTIALAQFGPGGLQSTDEQAPDTEESL